VKPANPNRLGIPIDKGVPASAAAPQPQQRKQVNWTTAFGLSLS